MTTDNMPPPYSLDHLIKWHLPKYMRDTDAGREALHEFARAYAAQQTAELQRQYALTDAARAEWKLSYQQEAQQTAELRAEVDLLKRFWFTDADPGETRFSTDYGMHLKSSRPEQS